MKDIFDLSEKVAIVTGASKGIGLSIARMLAYHGAKVVICSRRLESVVKAAEELKVEGLDVTAMPAHMGEQDQIQQLVDTVCRLHGGIDIVVNNAAINPVFAPILDTDLNILDKVMDVNLKGPILLSKLAHPHMKARGGGSIINISSIEGQTPGMGLGIYSISKASLIMATKVLAREWGADRIRANVICPGLVRTKFSEALTANQGILQSILAKQALPKVAEADDIAGMALFLASDAASFCTGAVLNADGGYTI